MKISIYRNDSTELIYTADVAIETASPPFYVPDLYETALQCAKDDGAIEDENANIHDFRFVEVSNIR